ncbi:cbb3-type cytochrome oxidase subunit 3 [Bowmanella dokdonensis]|uniref:Cbb3-type cytochrome c oxidase subunit 3 n=1 Tax=Bowmanella dokdonensis TaxID=751969 RepID=A0A939DKI8_9ALTE|nr:cbb3-type cytochrome c oxidase subunit 3 [Bowmanella dokdonensis]MBN7824255.1 cbb3-type cytochrome c oxidase subunit 3 [Bowmanella dokdonensis]
MDPVTVNIIWTVAIFVIFIAIVVWAFSKRAKKGFDEAANLVFDDEKQIKPEANLKKRESSNNE